MAEARMIVCSCNLITDHDIKRVVADLKEADPHVVLTPGLVFRSLLKRPNCGTCLPLFSRIMVVMDDALDNEAGRRPNFDRIKENERTPASAANHRRRRE